MLDGRYGAGEGRVRGFGDLEAAIMDRLWEHGTAMTVREIHTALSGERDLAYNTVLTVTDNLYKKGWLRREPAGRAHRYTPTASREQYGAGLMRAALDASGDPRQALLQLIGQMSGDETAALRDALTTFEDQNRP
jgi:predicted transcriptional regulator